MDFKIGLKRSVSIVLMTLSFMFIGACQSDDDVQGPLLPPASECAVPDMLYHGDYIPIEDTLSIGPACVNPNDPNDIIFYHGPTLKMYRYHRLHEELTFSNFAAPPVWSLKWNSNDQFAFVSGQNALLSVFGSGYEAPSMQIGGASWPAWGPNTDFMLYNAKTGFQAEDFSFVGSVSNALERDTMPSFLAYDRAWVSTNTVFNGGRVYSLGNDHFVEIVQTSGTHYTTAVDQSHFYTADRNSLYFIDASVSNYELVQNWSNCESFTNIQYHAGLDKIFATRVRRKTFAATNAIIEVRDLVWLNRDGTVHEEVDLLHLFYPE